MQPGGGGGLREGGDGRGEQGLFIGATRGRNGQALIRN
jgi:hypothetical protein